MKTIAYAVILILVTATTSCEKSNASQPKTPPGPDPMEVLEKQVAAERQLRTEAEGRVEKEAVARDLWQLATLGLGVVTLIAFIGGTAIGTRGRYHATSASRPRTPVGIARATRPAGVPSGTGRLEPQTGPQTFDPSRPGKTQLA